jgi:hypothetical protein
MNACKVSVDTWIAAAMTATWTTSVVSSSTMEDAWEIELMHGKHGWML